MIELRPGRDPKYPSYWDVYVDGNCVEQAYAHIREGFCTIGTKSAEASALVAAHSLSELHSNLDTVSLNYYPDDIEHLDRGKGTYIGQLIEFEGEHHHIVKDEYGEPKFKITLTIGSHALNEWREPYSFTDYAYEMYRILDARADVRGAGLDDAYEHRLESIRVEYDPIKDIKLALDEIDKNRIHALILHFIYSSLSVKICEEMKRVSGIIQEAREEAVGELAARARHSSVVFFFDAFPTEVRTPCEQYLLYFIQFLQDLGIEATPELKHEAGQVLFTVTPKDKEAALDKIRVALSVYLRLPTSPISNNVSNEIAINRLESAILRLQSDLRLSAAELQARNATIEAQQLTINIQKALLGGEIMIDSLKSVAPAQGRKDQEEILNNNAALKTIMKPNSDSEIDAATLYRLLKEWIEQVDDNR